MNLSSMINLCQFVWRKCSASATPSSSPRWLLVQAEPCQTPVLQFSLLLFFNSFLGLFVPDFGKEQREELVVVGLNKRDQKPKVS